MFFTINELSLSKLNDKTEAISVLMDFTNISHALIASGFKSIKIWDRNIFLSFELADNFKIVDWLKTKEFGNPSEKTRSQLLKRLIDKTSYLFDWNEEERIKISNCPLIYVNKGKDQLCSEGLKIACLYHTISISLSTHTTWNTSLLDLMYLDEHLEQNVSLRHASNIAHIRQHQNWITSLVYNGQLINWNPSKDMFPNLKSSNLCITNGDWDIFHKEKNNNKKPDGEIIEIITRYGKCVAESNFYIHDKKVSKENSSSDKKRIVYGAGEGKNRIYLSFDIKHGGFEVCNYKGKHLGAYFFNGDKKSGPQHFHDLKIT